MLTLENLSKSYNGRAILSSLSYCFPAKGQILLMAPSGAGKTTLLRLICGLEKPDGGKVTLDCKRLSVAFQEPRLAPWLTVLENVMLVLPNSADSEETARQCLAALELEPAANQYPAALSGGMKNRVSLARALAFGGDLLLLDEPFAGLDEGLKARIAPTIRAANQEGLTITVSHNKDDAALLGANILTLTGSPVSGVTEEIS